LGFKLPGEREWRLCSRMSSIMIWDSPRIQQRDTARSCIADVRLAEDGRGALQLSEDCSFDLILLDVMLPDQSDFDVVRQLRQRRQETPVLMLTARDALPDIVHGLEVPRIGERETATQTYAFAYVSRGCNPMAPIWPVTHLDRCIGCFVDAGDCLYAHRPRAGQPY
jgi:CheY-like chemotaxis protein